MANFLWCTCGVPPPQKKVTLSFASSNFGKVDPHTLDTWAGSLSQVTRSKLWLQNCPVDSTVHVVNELQARGISPSRLMFTPFAPRGEHIPRHALADVVLDTPRYK